MKKIILHSLVVLLLVLNACSSTEKVLKSSDTNFKYAKALEWYNKGQYYKAIPVFEELMGLYKGSKTTEEVYYYYCMAQHKQGNYVLAAFHFKNYVTKHPRSKYAEEALFMHAESFYKQSPKSNLDQSETINAIDAYQVFINQYPESERVSYGNDRIDELREKLEAKALRAARLYYRTENFRAAAFSYKNLLIDFPDIDNAEEIQFKIVQSFYKYADQSIVSKQLERFEDVIKVANTFIARYKESEYFDEVKTTLQNAHFEAINSSLRSAVLDNLKDRDESISDVFDIYDVHNLYIEEQKLKDEALKLREQAQFEVIKAQFLQAQNASIETKKKKYVETIQSYSEFINLYQDSKFNKEALRYFNASQKNIKKLSNG